MIILGVDPGLTGGLSVVDVRSPHILEATLIPLIDYMGKKTIDPYKLSDFIEKWSLHINLAVIEDVHAMPNQGVTSMFTFGRTLGTVIGSIGCYHIPMIYVKPSVWKLNFGLSHDKSLSFKKANEIFPNNIGLWPKKKYEGIVEASLIAYYGKRFFD